MLLCISISRQQKKGENTKATIIETICCFCDYKQFQKYHDWKLLEKFFPEEFIKINNNKYLVKLRKSLLTNNESMEDLMLEKYEEGKKKGRFKYDGVNFELKFKHDRIMCYIPPKWGKYKKIYFDRNGNFKSIYRYKFWEYYLLTTGKVCVDFKSKSKNGVRICMHFEEIRKRFLCQKFIAILKKRYGHLGNDKIMDFIREYKDGIMIDLSHYAFMEAFDQDMRIKTQQFMQRRNCENGDFRGFYNDNNGNDSRENSVFSNGMDWDD